MSFIFDAIGKNQYYTVRLLVDSVFDVNEKDKDGMEMNINAKNEAGETPLHLASEYNMDPDIVKTLLKEGAIVNIEDLSKSTPLHYAAINDKLDHVKVLIENEADVNVCNLNGFTPLHHASWKNNVKILEILFRNGAD
jgi:ankyrin repeat protein